MLSFLCCLWIISQLNAETVNITINPKTIIGTNNLYTTLQAVVLPPMLRSSPIHDAIYSSLKNLNADFVRLLFVSYYPTIGIAQIEPPSNQYMCKHLNGNDNSNNWNLTIQCPINSIINEISFASFGSPIGSCGDFSIGSCHSTNTMQIVKELCSNKNQCTIAVNNKTFDISNDIRCNNITYKSFSVQLKCNINTDNYKYSNWDFMSYMDQVMQDFYDAVNPNKKANKTVLDFGVYPNWKYQNVTYGEGYIDNPYKFNGQYSSIGNVLIDETASDVGDYFGKIIAYYYNGQFVDKYNQTIINKGKTYPIEILEILNDPEIEHQLNPQTYTILYDQIVTSIIKYTNNNKFKFMGLSLKNYDNYDYFSYFLNKSNHISADIPIDYISFNFFAGCDESVNCNYKDPNTYVSFFAQADIFIDAVNENITQIRDKLSPNTKIDIDEIGIGLSNNNPSQIPEIFWNAANAMYAYIYGKLQITDNIDIIGQSFLIGYPDLNQSQFPASPDPIDGFGGSITMLNYSTGAPNAKYWGLKIMIEYLNIGDKLIKTIINDGDLLFAQGYAGKNDEKILFVNKVNKNITVYVNDSNSFNKNGDMYMVDVNSGEGPARKESFATNEAIILQPYAVAIAVF